MRHMIKGTLPAGLGGFMVRLLVALIALAAPLAGASAQEPTVATTTGTFTAVPSPSFAGVNVFYGIRYAAPPEGSLRWTPPQAPVPPPGTVVAATPGAACPQPGGSSTITAEDCLFLNVFVPAGATPTSRLPVFYWIHGGSLITGSGAQYDPSQMVAEHDIIVVTINYRLGALGWLAVPGFAAAAADAFEKIGDAGNYGLMDQQFGMQWVQANIKGFGGDPAQVTIGGESAGGLSVSAHLASVNTAPGLFRGAIIESGAYQVHYVPTQAAYEAQYGTAFDSALGCTPPNDAACLRSASLDAIMAAQNKFFTGILSAAPDTGTLILPQELITAYATGQFIQVPVLQGSNLNEGRTFEPDSIPFAASLAQVAAAGGPANYDLSNPNTFCATPEGTGSPVACTYVQEINLYLTELGASPSINTPAIDGAVAGLYPLANFPDPYLADDAPSADEALAQILTDVGFACNTWDSDINLARWVPLYAYEFNDPNAPGPFGSVLQAPNDQFGYPTGSEHGSELQYLFDFDAPFAVGEQHLSHVMQTYWANFVISQNPNVGSPPTFYALWMPFNLLHGIQELIPAPGVAQPTYGFHDNHFCSIWEPVVAAQ